jgi:hypothetical protein
MAMKPSSKFERMKLKPSQAMSPKPSMPTGTNDPAAGGGAMSTNPMAKARKQTLKKMVGKY